MTNNSSFQVFKGGWSELENAIHTSNQNTQAPIKSSFIKADGELEFSLHANAVVAHPLSVSWDIASVSPIFTTSETISPTVVLGESGIHFSTDGLTMFILGSANDTLGQYSLTIPFDISTQSFVASFSFNPTDNLPTDIFFSNDGKTLFMCGSENDSVYQFSLIDAFDIFTNPPSLEFTFSVSSQTLSPQGIQFSLDGLTMYVTGDLTAKIFQYSLTNAFDFSISPTIGASDFFDVTAQDTSPMGIAFSTDGLTMFMIGTQTGITFQYVLKTPFDIVTSPPTFVGGFNFNAFFPRCVTFSSNGFELYIAESDQGEVFQFSLITAFDVAGITQAFVIDDDDNPSGLFFKDDGTKMFLTGQDTDNLFEYILPVPWDVSSIVASPNILSLSALASDPLQCAFSRDGDFAFITDGASVFSFPLSTAWDITSSGISSSFTPGGGVNVDSVAFKTQGDRMYIGDVTNDEIREYTLDPPFDISTPVFVIAFDTSPDSISPFDIFWRSTGDQLFIVGTTEIIQKYHLEDAWDISTASYFSNVFSIVGISLRSMVWRPDGLILYLLDNTNDEVRSFSVTTPFNLTNISLSGTLSITPEDNNPQGMWWKNDGTRLYVIGTQTKTVFQYTAATPWSLTGMTFSSTSFNTGISVTTTGIIFSPDGLKMYISTVIPNTIFQWNLSGAYVLPINLSVADETRTLTGDNVEPRDLFIKPDGTQMFFASNQNDEVVRYLFGTPFEIDTIVIKDRLDISSLEPNPQGLYITPNDGKKLFVCGIDTGKIVTFDMSLEFNNNIITEFGDDLVTQAGDNIVHTQ